MFDNTGGGGLVEIEKPPYLVLQISARKTFCTTERETDEKR